MVQNKIRIAAIQTNGIPGKVDENLSHAEAFIRSAAAEGAQLAVLPEVSSSAYFLTPPIWDSAETIQGTTFQWMSALSRELNIWLGAGIVETDGEHIYNTYLITQQDGSLATAVRKHNPERYFYRPGRSSRVLETPFGKLGIAICADNHYKDLVEEYLRESVDLVLMPHAWFSPVFPAGPVSQKDIDEKESLTPHAFPKNLVEVLDANGEKDQELTSRNWASAKFFRPFSDGYGYQWWLDEDGAYSAVGAGGQYIMVVPEENLIMVVTNASSGIGVFFPRKVLDKYVLPSIVSDEAIAANEAAHSELLAKSGPPELVGEPQAVPELPATALEISSKTYSLEANNLKYDNFQLPVPKSIHA